VGVNLCKKIFSRAVGEILRSGLWEMTIKTATSISIALLLLAIVVNYAHAGCNPSTGTAGDDVIVCTDAVTGLETYGGSDKVQLNQVTGHSILWLDEKPGGNPATDGNDTLIANDSEFFWAFTFGGDDKIIINNSTFSNVYGDTNPFHGGNAQRGNDTIIITNSASNGWILGGNDADTITIKDSTVSFVASGYSNVYETGSNPEYTPYDGDDTVLLDHVHFSPENYAGLSQPGTVGGGKGNDTITFIHGGDVYAVSGGHGSDTITVNDGELIHACVRTSNNGRKLRCGIFADEDYAIEKDPVSIPVNHGNDLIYLNNASLAGAVVNCGHGSDLLQIKAPVVLYSDGVTLTTQLDGGDDRSAADTFIDRLVFDGWSGDVNGSDLLNWESIVLDNHSAVSFNDTRLETGMDPGVDSTTGLPYGLIIRNNSVLNQHHEFQIDGNLYNYANIDTRDGNTPGMVLTVTRDYVSDGSGKLHLDVCLNDASTTISDQMVVQGDTEGKTTLYVDNVGCSGGKTPTGPNDGILVVQVNGKSNGVFVLGDPAPQAGGYVYKLVKGNDGNWRLQSIGKPAEVPEPSTALLISSGPMILAVSKLINHLKSYQ